MESYRMHIASEKIYNYFWKTFCDEHIEKRKVRIAENNDKESAQLLLLTLLRELTATLHPFMPFLTEEIWGLLPDRNLVAPKGLARHDSAESNLLIVEPWPKLF